MTESTLLRHLLWVTLLALIPLTAAADIVNSINKVRAHGCPGRHAGQVFLRESRQLDAVARQLSRGLNLVGAQKGRGIPRGERRDARNVRGTRQ